VGEKSSPSKKRQLQQYKTCGTELIQFLPHKLFSSATRRQTRQTKRKTLSFLLLLSNNNNSSSSKTHSFYSLPSFFKNDNNKRWTRLKANRVFFLLFLFTAQSDDSKVAASSLGCDVL